jgi:uncharacterized protein
VDHLLGERVGARARLTFYAGIIDDYYLTVDLPREAYARVAELNRQFANLQLGSVDAALVAMAETLGVSRIATTDRRRFTPLAAALSLELLPDR